MTELTTPATSSERAPASGDPGEAGIRPVSPGLGPKAGGGEAHAPAGAGAPREEVLVLDFGGPCSQLIARRIRECGVFAELLPHDVPLEAIAERRPAALVLS